MVENTLKPMYLAGVDEAGRGPVLGPLVVAGVVLHQDDLPALIDNGLADSKLVSKIKREELYQEILSKVIDYKVVIIEAIDIDTQRANAINLNKIELNSFIDVLQTMKKWSKAYVDACDRNAEKFQLTLQNTVSTNIIAEHFADQKYPIVSAASIIAKVIRDREIEKHHKEYGVDFGSGYSHDAKTNQFLNDYIAKYGKLPLVARKSWETSRKAIETHEQASIDEYFSNAE